MHAQRLIASLARFPERLLAVVNNLDRDDARWKPTDDSWSILEVVAHLVDEEREDFRKRLELTLRDSNLDWPAIDPVVWAIQRKYNEREFHKSVAEFIGERRVSIEWLGNLHASDWTTAHTHPKLGPMRAGDLLVSWAAHDLLHLRQITKRLYQLVQRAGGEFSADYAGAWTG